VPFKYEFPPLLTYHTFEASKERFLCEEVLYVSDFATQSHYARANPKNKSLPSYPKASSYVYVDLLGTQTAGKILVDMTFLRDGKLIQRIEPAPGSQGRPHYKVEYELVAIVEGRNLRYEARYPPGGNGRVQKAKQVSIAAAFRPGTK